MNANMEWRTDLKPGDLVYVFAHYQTAHFSNEGEREAGRIGIITTLEMPAVGSLQIPFIEALVDGRIIEVSYFSDIRKVEDCHEESDYDE